MKNFQYATRMGGKLKIKPLKTMTQTMTQTKTEVRNFLSVVDGFTFILKSKCGRKY